MNLRFRREIPDVAINFRIGQFWRYRPRSAVLTFETGVSGIWDQLQLHSKFNAYPGYMRICLNKPKYNEVENHQYEGDALIHEAKWPTRGISRDGDAEQFLGSSNANRSKRSMMEAAKWEQEGAVMEGKLEDTTTKTLCGVTTSSKNYWP